MKLQVLRDAIAEFIAIIDNGLAAPEGTELRLRLLLDRIALAVSEYAVQPNLSNYIGGDGIDYARRRARVRALFPNYGSYNVPEIVTKDIASTAITVGDAIDDIVDITTELAAVSKIWESEGETRAMQALAGAYQVHLGDHLRNLQRYLHARSRELDGE